MQKGIYDEPISCFFRNVDKRYLAILVCKPIAIALSSSFGSHGDIPIGNGKGKIQALKARVRCCAIALEIA